MIDQIVMTKIRQDNTRLFDICDLISITIKHITELSRVNNTNIDHIIFSTLFCRIVNSFTSAKLLISFGYIQDAGTVTRSLLETLFVFKACIESKEYLEKYRRTDVNAVENAYKRYSQYAMRLKADGSLDDLEAKKCLYLYEIELEKYKDMIKTKLNYCEAASKAGLHDMYDLIYPYLSTLNSHPSIRSLGDRIALDECGDVAEFKLGPEEENAGWMLALLIQPMIVAIECINKKFHLGFEKEIASIFEKFCEEREKLPIG